VSGAERAKKSDERSEITEMGFNASGKTARSAPLQCSVTDYNVVSQRGPVMLCLGLGLKANFLSLAFAPNALYLIPSCVAVAATSLLCGFL